MVNIDEALSIVIFMTFLLFAIVYFSKLQQPSAINLERAASDVSKKMLTEYNLIWNASKVRIFVNSTQSLNLYPVTIRYVFPNSTSETSVKVKETKTSKDVLFTYANKTISEITFLANLSAGMNFFDLYYSDSSLSQTIPTDLATSGLDVQNNDIYVRFSSLGKIQSVSYKNSDNLITGDSLVYQNLEFSPTSYERISSPVVVKYIFTNGTATKTYKIYAFNPRITMTTSIGNFTWSTKWILNFNRSYTNRADLLNGSNSIVFSGETDFVDLFTSPGISTPAIAFSDRNMNTTIFDSSYREINLTKDSPTTYELFFHTGSYSNAQNENDIYLGLNWTKGARNVLNGISLSKISTLNSASYETTKTNLNADRDFRIQVENISTGNLLLDYGEINPNATNIVVSKKHYNLLTTNYNNEEVIVRVKVW